jgi:Uma2 family endonuclease
VEKRVVYAKAGVTEYWIVDPEEKKITVLALEGDHYREDGVYYCGDQAISRLFDGFNVNVAATFEKCHKKDGDHDIAGAS